MGNFHIIIIIRQCSKEVLPSQQILVLDPGKVVIRSDHLAPCPPGIGGFSVHLHQMGALGIIASYSIGYELYENAQKPLLLNIYISYLLQTL